MMSEPGGSFFSNEEAANLRAYLLKGGFLWVDDFWGSVAWRNWENQIGKALSPSEYPDRRSQRRPHDVPHAVPRAHAAADSERRPLENASGARRSAAPTATSCTCAASRIATGA